VHHSHLRYYSGLFALVLGACGGGGIGNRTDGGTPPPDFAGDPNGHQQAIIGPIPLAPGQERTVCSRYRLTSPTAIDVTRIDAALAPGSHHLIFWKSMQTTEQKDIYDCQALDLSTGDIPLYIAETQSNNNLPLPTGAAYHLEAGQMIRLEAHYINATPNPLMGMGTVNLTVGPTGTQYQPADIMFCGSVTQLYTQGVPPGMSSLNPGFYKPPAGVKIFGLTTHEHKRGTLMTIDRSTSSAAGQNLTMGTPYDNPPFEVYGNSNLLTFAPGEGFRWQCFYDNPTNTTYKFGQSAEANEMCFFWAYYYPSVGHFISQECIQ
jgi:hypothetical protein